LCDFVPADIQLIEGTLDLDQSVLTGESETVEKSGGNSELVYSGSSVKHGETTGIVYTTGTRTYFGKSVELVELAKRELIITVARASVKMISICFHCIPSTRTN
jgi:H+-transporting ATPase